MQTFPQANQQHLSRDAALMLLAVLPPHIRDAYINHAKQIDYSIELVLEIEEEGGFIRLPISSTDGW